MKLLLCAILFIAGCGSDREYCPRCKGEGKITVTMTPAYGESYTTKSRCPVCKGEGIVASP